MQEKIQSILDEAKKSIMEISNEQSLSDAEIKYLGRKAELNLLMRELKNLTPEEKKVIGPMANQAKQEIKSLLDKKR